MIPSLRIDTYFPNRRSRVAVSREPHQEPIGQHRHEFFEIAIVLSGSGVHVTGDYRHGLQAGDALVIDHRRAHGYERTENLNLINILLRQDALSRIGRELRGIPGYHALFGAGPVRWRQAYAGHLRLSGPELGQLEEWAARLEEETSWGASGGNLLAEAYLTLIIGALSRCRDRLGAPPRRPEKGMGKVLSWMEKNLHKPLQMGDIARFAGMSERTFYRSFREIVGMSPGIWLLNARMQRGAGLLRHSGDLTITEVAHACGFDDSNYFSKCFRAAAGRSPREFRKVRAPGSHRKQPLRLAGAAR